MTDTPDQYDVSAMQSKAQGGDVNAQISLAQWYLDGSGCLEQNSEQAAFWFKKAADQDDPHAQYMLAMRYTMGDGVPQDKVRALRLFEKAASKDDGYSLLQVALAYFDGEYVKQNIDAAAQCFRKASEAGNANATYYYARCLLSGLGVSENIQLGIKCLEKAAQQDREDARQLLDEIKEIKPTTQTSESSYAEISTQWEHNQSTDILPRMQLLAKLTDYINHNKEPLTKESIALYIEILKKAVHLPGLHATASKTLSKLLLEHTKLSGRDRVDIINEIESQDLGKGRYVIGDPNFLNELRQWRNHHGYQHLVDMINEGKLFAFTVPHELLGVAHLRVIDCDEPVLLKHEYTKLKAASETYIINIQSGNIGIYQWNAVTVKMTLAPGHYKICAYQLSQMPEFYIVMCKTNQPAANALENLPDLS